MINRITSIIVAVAYLAIAYSGVGGEAALRTLLFLILPLACIWFGDEMGSFTGIMRGQYVNATTPGCLVTVGGWLLLALPAIIGIVFFLRRD